jgi:excisionase family DNA binding protein
MLTVKHAAQILNVSQGLVYALCAQGKLEHERYGLGRGTIRIREDALAQYQTQAKCNPSLPGPIRPGVFTHLNGERLAQAWKSRGVL